MTRDQLAHVIRAAADAVGDGRILVVGSQAILASHDENLLPEQVVFSIEADIAFLDDPEESKADLVDGSIGEGSQFHEHFGYYAQGVGLKTAVLPEGWEERALRFRFGDVGTADAACPEIHDLAVSKLVAGRQKDFEFVQALLVHGLVEACLLLDRVKLLDRPGAVKRRISDWIDRQC